MAIDRLRATITATNQFTAADTSTGVIDKPSGASGAWTLVRLLLDLGADTKTTWKAQIVTADGDTIDWLAGSANPGAEALDTEFVAWQGELPMMNGDVIHITTTGATQAMALHAMRSDSYPPA